MEPTHDVVVTTEFAVDTTGERPEIRLQDQRTLRFDPENRQASATARVLAQLRGTGRPVYLEIDPTTSVISSVRLPVVGRVVTLDQTPSGLEIELDASHAIHVLPRDAENAREFETVLTAAHRDGLTLAVTVDDARRVLDVREFTPDLEGPVPPMPPFPRPLPRVPFPFDRNALLRRLWDILRWWWFVPWWPWWWFRGLSKTRAQQVFDEMAATSCAPPTVPAPCIPFLYPDDGCWARAHEMCRLMINLSLSPRKVWIDRSIGHVLHVLTKNNPNCYVEWGWHVAPTLLVRSNWPWSQRLVFDPSLFGTPVTQATWKGVQGDPGATLTDTTADVFWHGGGADPTYTASNSILAQYRAALQLRSQQVGPPPYANC